MIPDCRSPLPSLLVISRCRGVRAILVDNKQRIDCLGVWKDLQQTALVVVVFVCARIWREGPFCCFCPRRDALIKRFTRRAFLPGSSFLSSKGYVVPGFVSCGSVNLVAKSPCARRRHPSYIEMDFPHLHWTSTRTCSLLQTPNDDGC